MEFKWEVGKKYRTRGGKWAICASITPPHPVSGDNLSYPVTCHHEDGSTVTHTVCGASGCAQRREDIIGEWVEPLEVVVDVLLLQSVRFPMEYSNSTSIHAQYQVGFVGTWYGSQYRVVDIQTVTLKYTPKQTG